MGNEEMVMISTNEKPAPERFMHLVRVMLADFWPLEPKKKKELDQMFWNRLLDLPGQSAKPAGHNVRQFFGRSPRGLANLRADYLIFLIHAYLNEIYTLEERMCAYLKTLQRAARKGSDVRDRLNKINPDLWKVVNDTFKNVRRTRSAHVHEQGFCDDGIDRLRTFELMNQFPRHFPAA